MTKSNWRDELYLGERVGGAGTLVRQGIKVGGKKGGRAVQKGQDAAVRAGQGAKEKVKQGNQKKMVGDGKYEKAGAMVGGLAGGLAGGVLDGPLPVGDIVGGIAGSKIGGKIGRQFDKRAEKKKLAQSEEVEVNEILTHMLPSLGAKAIRNIPKAIETGKKAAKVAKGLNTARKVAPYAAAGGLAALAAKDVLAKKKKPVGITTAVKKEETLLYDVVHDYIIAEDFASNTEGANKVILKLSDELMQEIYERTMTASEKRKDTMLKKKYDDSDMKKNMQAQYGKEEGKKVYFATIRKQAMKKEEVESVEEKIKYDKSGSSMDYFLGADPKKTEYYKKNAKKKIKKEEVEQVDEKMSNYDRNRKAAAKRAAARNAARDAGKTGYVPGVGYVSPRRERETYRNEAGVTMHHKGYKAEEVEVVNEVSKKTLGSYVKKAATEIGTSAMKGDYKKMQKRHKGVLDASDKLAKEEVIPEAKYEAGASTYGKATIRNKRKFGTPGEMPDIMTGKKITKDATRGELISKRREEHKAKRGVKEEVGITTHSMMMKDKAKKEAMIRMKEREAVAKKLRKEERDEYGDPVGGPKISKKQKEKNLKKNTPDEQHTTTTSEGYGSDRVGPALTMARAIDKVNPRPKPNSKRTRVSRALKLASIKKDEKIRKRQENPYSADKRLKMVATSIRDRVKQKARAMTTREGYIPEEGYDIARDMGRVRPSKDKKDATSYPPSEEMKKTQKVNKGPSALERVKKKYGKAVMVIKKK